MTSDVEGQSSIVYFVGTGQDRLRVDHRRGGQRHLGPRAGHPEHEPDGTIGTTARTRYQSVRLHTVSSWARRLLVVSFGPNNGVRGLPRSSTSRTASGRRTTSTTGQHPDEPVGHDDGLRAGPARQRTLLGTELPPDTGTKVRSWLRDDSGRSSGSRRTYLDRHLPAQLRRPEDTQADRIGQRPRWRDPAGQRLELPRQRERGPTITAILSPSTTSLGTYGYDPSGVGLLAARRVLTARLHLRLRPRRDDGGVQRGQLRARRLPLHLRDHDPVAVHGTTTPIEVYAIDIGYMDWQEAGRRRSMNSVKSIRDFGDVRIPADPEDFETTQSRTALPPMEFTITPGRVAATPSRSRTASTPPRGRRRWLTGSTSSPPLSRPEAS